MPLNEGAMLSLLRLVLPALFPSWRFFQDVGPSPVVEVYCDRAWVEARPRPDAVGVFGAGLTLVWNSDCAERLYLTSCAERFLAEPSPWLLDQITSLLPEEATAFRIILRHRSGAQIMDDVAIESPQR